MRPLAVILAVATAAPPRAADAGAARARKPTTATLVMEKCLLSVEVAHRTVYRGKPRCQNQPAELEVTIPRGDAALVRTKNASFYASAGFWAVHDDEFWIPLVAGKRYVIGEGYAILENETDPSVTGTHCVAMTTDRASRFDTWTVEHFADRYGPFDVTTAAKVGGHYNEHRFRATATTDSALDVIITYRRLFPGSYRFHVGRRGKVTLSYDAADRCSP